MQFILTDWTTFYAYYYRWKEQLLLSDDIFCFFCSSNSHHWKSLKNYLTTFFLIFLSLIFDTISSGVPWTSGAPLPWIYPIFMGVTIIWHYCSVILDNFKEVNERKRIPHTVYRIIVLFLILIYNLN